MGASSKCIVFDLDDTLCLERDFALSGFIALARQYAPSNALEFYKAGRHEFDYGDRRHIFNSLAEQFELAVDVMEMVEAYRLHSPSISMLPDARFALDHCRDRGWPIGIITDGLAQTQRNKISALALPAWSDLIIATGELGSACGKPSPIAFKEIQASCSAQEYWYVGDNPAKDFIAPNSLGWTSVRVKRPHGVYVDQVAASKEDAAAIMVDDLWELVAQWQ